MATAERRFDVLAIGLSALAGFVDGIGLLHLGGFFLSSVSANTTIFGVGIAEGSARATVAAGLIGSFLVGVIAGSIVLRRAGSHPRTTLLLLVCTLLVIAASLNTFGAAHGPIIAMALAMGATGSVFERDGTRNSDGTFLTALLVKLGQEIAGVGDAGHSWRHYLLRWLGFSLGAIAGAALYSMVALDAVWIAATAAAVLTLMAIPVDKARAASPGAFDA